MYSLEGQNEYILHVFNTCIHSGLSEYNTEYVQYSPSRPMSDAAGHCGARRHSRQRQVQAGARTLSITQNTPSSLALGAVPVKKFIHGTSFETMSRRPVPREF